MGAIGMVGAYVAFDATAPGKVLNWTIPAQPFWSSLLLGTLVSAALGALVQVLVMRPLGQRSALVKVIATLGVLLTLQALVILHWTSVAKVPASPLPQGLVSVFGSQVNVDEYILLGVAVVVTAVLSACYRYTRFGLSPTAVAENETVAASLGRSPNAVAVANWVDRQRPGRRVRHPHRPDRHAPADGHDQLVLAATCPSPSSPASAPSP